MKQKGILTHLLLLYICYCLLFLIQRFQGEIEGGAFPFFGIEPQLAAELFDKVFAQH